MNQLVISFYLYNCNYCGVLHLETGAFGLGTTYRHALRNSTYDSRDFWEYRKFLITIAGKDLLDQPIIKGPYRFRTLRKHLMLTRPELLI